MNKKKYFILFLIISLIVLVTLKFFIKKEIKQPEFKRIDNISIINSSQSKMVLSANMVFYNPNKKNALLLNTYLKIFSKEIQIGTISSQEVTELNKLSEVSIPTIIELDLNNLKSSQNLSELLETVLNDSKGLEVTFKGDVKVSVGKMNFTIPINHKEIINI